MSSHTYARTGFSSASQGTPSLSGRVEAAFPGKSFTIRGNGAEFVINFPDDELLAGEITALDAEVAAWAPESLAEFKLKLMEVVDTEANRRIVELGFEYPPASGQVLSCTVEAQTKWLGAYALRSNPIFTYPFTVRTKDDAIEVSIPDAAGIEECFLTLSGTVMYHLGACRVAKGDISAAVDAAASQAALDAYMAG